MRQVKLNQIYYTWRTVKGQGRADTGLGLFAASGGDEEKNAAAAEIAGHFQVESVMDDGRLPLSRFLVYSDALKSFVCLRVSSRLTASDRRREPFIHVFFLETASERPEDYLTDYPFDGISMTEQFQGVIPGGPVTVPSAVFDEERILKKLGFASSYEDIFEDPDDPVGRLAALMKRIYSYLTYEEGQRIRFVFGREEGSPFADPAGDDRSAAELIYLLTFLIPYSEDGLYLHELSYSIDSNSNIGNARFAFSDRGEGILLGRKGVSLPVPEGLDEFFLQAAEKAVKEGLEAARSFIEEVMRDRSALSREKLQVANIRHSYWKWKMNRNGYLDYQDIRADIRSLCSRAERNFWYREFLADFLQKGRGTDPEVRNSIWQDVLLGNLAILQQIPGYEFIKDYTLSAAGQYLLGAEGLEATDLLDQVPEDFRGDVLTRAFSDRPDRKETLIGNAIDECDTADSLTGKVFRSFGSYIRQSQSLGDLFFDRADRLYTESEDPGERKKLSECVRAFRAEEWNAERNRDADRFQTFAGFRDFVLSRRQILEEAYFFSYLSRFINLLDDDELTEDFSKGDFSRADAVWKALWTMNGNFSVPLDLSGYEDEYRKTKDTYKETAEKKKIKKCESLTEILSWDWKTIAYPANRRFWIKQAIVLLQNGAGEHPGREAVRMTADRYGELLKRILDVYGDEREKLSKHCNHLDQACAGLVYGDPDPEARLSLWREKKKILEDRKYSWKGVLKNNTADRQFWETLPLTEQGFDYLFLHLSSQEKKAVRKEDLRANRSSLDTEGKIRMAAYRMYAAAREGSLLLPADTGVFRESGQTKCTAETVRLLISGVKTNSANDACNLLTLLAFLDKGERFKEYKDLYSGRRRLLHAVCTGRFGRNSADEGIRKEIGVYCDLEAISRTEGPLSPDEFDTVISSTNAVGECLNGTDLREKIDGRMRGYRDSIAGQYGRYRDHVKEINRIWQRLREEEAREEEGGQALEESYRNLWAGFDPEQGEKLRRCFFKATNYLGDRDDRMGLYENDGLIGLPPARREGRKRKERLYETAGGQSSLKKHPAYEDVPEKGRSSSAIPESVFPGRDVGRPDRQADDRVLDAVDDAENAAGPEPSIKTGMPESAARMPAKGRGLTPEAKEESMWDAKHLMSIFSIRQAPGAGDRHGNQ